MYKNEVKVVYSGPGAVESFFIEDFYGFRAFYLKN
jgi:hypothetical protein